jgi:CRP-like cAMP-binding protein
MPESPYLNQVTQIYYDSEVIFEEGSFGHEMHIVHSGVMKLVKKSTERKFLIATIAPGEFFGEMALVDNAPRSLSVVAAADHTRLLTLDRDKLLESVNLR